AGPGCQGEGHRVPHDDRGRARDRAAGRPGGRRQRRRARGAPAGGEQGRDRGPREGEHRVQRAGGGTRWGHGQGRLPAVPRAMSDYRIKRASLTKEVSHQLQRYIEDRGLKPGDELPTELELTQMFGVSRTVIPRGGRSRREEGKGGHV